MSSLSYERYEPLTPFSDRVAQMSADIRRNDPQPRRLKIFEKACASVDVGKVEALQDKYRSLISSDVLDGANPLKYLDLPYYIWHKCRIAARLDLDRLSPMSILDIGMGGGHFGVICKALGHRPYGLDIQNDFYEDVCDTFGLHRHTEAIEKDKPLPDFRTRFGLVTAFSLMFHFERVGRERVYWGADAWGAFFDDLGRHLAPEASIYLILNPKRLPNGELLGHEDMTELFERCGAEVLKPGREVWFRKTGPVSLLRVPAE